MPQKAPDWRVFSSSAAEPAGMTNDRAGLAEQRSSLGEVVRTWSRAPLVPTIAVAATLGVAGLVLGAVILVATATGGGPTGREGQAQLTEIVDTEAIGSVTVSGASLVIDVAGAVARPGLIRMTAGQRVGDAIAAAGGFGPRADADEVARSLNLAEPLSDGMKVLVPGLEPDRGGTSDEPAPGLIDLNTADQATLETLPGVGPVTAARIIEAREQSRFREVADLRSREVVGESVFERIRGLVRAGS